MLFAIDDRSVGGKREGKEDAEVSHPLPSHGTILSIAQVGTPATLNSLPVVLNGA